MRLVRKTVPAYLELSNTKLPHRATTIGGGLSSFVRFLFPTQPATEEEE